ncbi:MAG: ArnT family glycosyltransferase [Candidatus Magasanikbacteria bacterium]
MKNIYSESLKYIKNHRKEIILLISYFIIIASISAILFKNYESKVMISGGNPEYLNLSRNLLEHGAFSSSKTKPLKIISSRTPGYPLFLSILRILPGNFLFYFIILQSLLTTIGLLFIFKLTKKITSYKWTPYLAATLYGFDIYTVVQTSYAMTEVLYTPLLIIGAYYFIEFLDKKRKKEVALSGLFFGLSSLVRPTSLYLIFFIPIIYFLFQTTLNRQKIFQECKKSLIFIAIFGAIIFPWFLRNKIVFNNFKLTSLSPHALNVNYLLDIYAKKYNTSTNKAKEIMINNVLKKGKENIKNFDKKWENRFSFKLSKYYNHQAKKTFLQYPWLTIKSNLFGVTLDFFLSSGYKNIAQNLTNSKAGNKITGRRLFKLLKTGKIRKIIILLNNNNNLINITFLAGLFLSSLYLILLIINTLWDIKILLTNKKYQQNKTALKEIFLLSIILYHAGLTGSFARGRFRFPVLGFIIIFALIGLEKVILFLKKNKQCHNATKIKKRD